LTPPEEIESLHPDEFSPGKHLGLRMPLLMPALKVHVLIDVMTLGNDLGPGLRQPVGHGLIDVVALAHGSLPWLAGITW
jgi:hypothetical protein